MSTLNESTALRYLRIEINPVLASLYGTEMSVFVKPVTCLAGYKTDQISISGAGFFEGNEAQRDFRNANVRVLRQRVEERRGRGPIEKGSRGYEIEVEDILPVLRMLLAAAV